MILRKMTLTFLQRKAITTSAPSPFIGAKSVEAPISGDVGELLVNQSLGANHDKRRHHL
jgi:hypothetical protein